MVRRVTVVLAIALIAYASSSGSDERLSGLFDCSPNRDTLAPLPLLGVNVESHMVDLVSRTTIAQHYHHQGDRTINAVYFFPLDNHAAVHEFETEIDGRVTKGKIQEKSEARATFNKAVASGFSAQLLEQRRPDVFEIHVGNLEPGQHCIVRITYVAELRVQQSAAAFFLPTFVAPRYSPASEPDPVAGTGPVAVRNGLTVTVTATMASAITAITSPTHKVEIQHVAGSSVATVSLREMAQLDKDFELLITTANPHAPRAILEPHPELGPAVVVAFVPKVELRDQPSDLIFIVDRSGSMDGTKMAQASQTLQLFIRSLPVSCYFNIVGFGSTFSSLFPQSVKNSPQSQAAALQYAAQMEADMGGTEIAEPLSHVLSQPLVPGHARQVFVLTDGEVSNTEEVISLVTRSSASARVFSLGLGDGASRELVEGIARAGRGTSDFVLGSAPSSQELAGKVINQLSRATQPAMEDVEVILQGMEEPSSSFMSLGGSLLGYIAPGKAMAVTQAPRFVPPIFSGSRFLMYFMLPLGSRLPTSVLVRAKTADGPLQLHLDIGPNNTLPEGGTVVHTLAARARVQDLQDGRGSTEDIVQLGLRYNLTTQHTSFVAVDNIPRNSLESLVDAGVQTHRASARMKLFAHSHLVGSAENFVLDTAGASNDVLLLDVSPLTLGVEDMAGNMVAVIPRNSVIPTRKEAVVSGRANEHGTVTIRCFQGERPRAEHNSLLATLQVTGLTPQLDHPILVIITIDVNGEITVQAGPEASRADLSTFTSVTLDSSTKLDQETIERMIAEANEYADQGKNEPDLGALAATQAFDGHFSDTETLATALGVTLEDLRSAVPAGETLAAWSTALATEVLTDALEYRLIVHKALQWLASSTQDGAPTRLVAAAQAYRASKQTK